MDNIKLKNNQRLYLFPLSDTHVGHENFNEEFFEFWETIFKTTGENKRVYILGDLVDFPSTRVSAWDNRMSPNEAEDWIVKKLKPYRDWIAGVVSGNHEDRSMKIHNYNVAESIAKQLGVPYSQTGDFYDCFKINGKEFTVNFKHGTKFSKSPDLAMKNFKQDSINNSEADMYLMGHNHYCMFSSDYKRNKDKGKRRFYGFTGHFLKYTGSYAHKLGYNVNPASFMRISVDNECNCNANIYPVDVYMQYQKEI